MDVYCSKCGEPWDLLGITDEAEEHGLTPTEMHRKFQREGCEALGSSHGDGVDREVRGLRASDAAAAMADLLGDDVDGAAAMMEDFGF